MEIFLLAVIAVILILLLSTSKKLWDKDSEIAYLNKKIREKDDEISHFSKLLDEKVKKIKDLEKEASEQSKQISDQAKEIAERLKEIASLREDFELILDKLEKKNEEVRQLKKDLEFYSNIKAASEGMNEEEEERELTLSDLDEEQRSAFDLMMNSDENLFITGKAGTGKSALLKVFAKETKKTILKLAPTGIAAINIKGATLHSVFGYDNLIKLSYDEITSENLKLNSNKQRVLRNVKSIIIDEISMVRADILEKVDMILKLLNETELPFGGKQMIFFGDIFQIPPVAKRDERQYLNDRFGGIHFFDSFAYERGSFKFIELTVNHRQTDDKEFFEILNDIRAGTVSEKQLDLINERTSFDSKELRVVTRLFSKKAEVEEFNKIALERNIGKEFISRAKVLYPENGEYPGKGKDFNFESNFPVTEVLKLKKGALVMFVKNNGDKWANGTLGIVSEIYKDKIIVSIENEDHEVYPTTFEQLEAKYGDGKIKYDTVCKISQYPIILAYAMTIHKAQGQTYGKIACDVSECFAPGQAYVALSRVKRLKGLYLLSDIHKEQIQVDSCINDFYNRSRK